MDPQQRKYVRTGKRDILIEVVCDTSYISKLREAELLKSKK